MSRTLKESSRNFPKPVADDQPGPASQFCRERSPLEFHEPPLDLDNPTAGDPHQMQATKTSHQPPTDPNGKHSFVKIDGSPPPDTLNEVRKQKSGPLVF